jgi:succinylglutamic semialdehyde dehydrogenase
MMHPALFNNGRWETGAGTNFRSINPATGQVVWEGAAADHGQTDRAIEAARAAAPAWAERSIDQRISFLNAFAKQLKSHRDELAEAISLEIGKPKWESLTEVDAMVNKVPVSIRAFQERRQPMENKSGAGRAATRFKPHGVVGVFGPFNFPGHLPNGHIVPALLAGNTVVFKPSELAPLTAEKMVQFWEAAGLPQGVLNLVQGGREVGEALVAHPGLDGIFFTGSAGVGKAMRRALADHPEKILALEMGGNNPLIVHEASDTSAAVYHTIQSAFLTAGQRCTCARRLIVPIGFDGDVLIDALTRATRDIQVGPFTNDPEPFIGPVVNDAAAEKLLSAQARLLERGGKSLVEMRSLNGRPAMLSPGIIDVSGIADRARADEELFGPLLQIIRVADFDAALVEANRTAYGLSAALFSDNRLLYEKFYRVIRAGVVNWNRPTTGASGTLPFGGIGLSGNHRPSGYYAADYCSYPVASMEAEKLELPAKLAPGIIDR